MKPKEHLVSCAYKRLYLSLSGMLSYRNVAKTMNSFLHKEETAKVKVSTLEDRVELQGKKLSATYTEKATGILASHGIDPKTGIIAKTSPIAISLTENVLPPILDETSVRQLVVDYNRDKDSKMELEYGLATSNIETSTNDCCYVSIDDVGVRFQKAERSDDYKKDRKFIENTVIHIQKGDQKYTITAIGMENAFRQLVAFLLSNNLMEECRLVFLTDGATNIRDNIETYFGFRQYTLILDWYHLEKKCNEFLSMILNGKKEEKNEIKQELATILWTGRVDKALDFLGDLDKSKIKNTKKFDELKGYLDRKSPNITYALRHQLGLRTSSNRVEKANDLVVATRQKHNGMSWSENGSGALAIITAAKMNGELDNWIETGEVGFTLVA